MKPVYVIAGCLAVLRKFAIVKEAAAFRRVVPSPLPMEIFELEAIKAVLKKRLVPVAVGGGGIPIIKEKGQIKLVDAVIDKDFASQVLTSQLEADQFVILTDVKKAALNFGKKNQMLLGRISLKKARDYLSQGHFPPGSMGPKIESALKFIEKGGKKQ